MNTDPLMHVLAAGVLLFFGLHLGYRRVSPDAVAAGVVLAAIIAIVAVLV